jgi:hypothetical protein
MEIGAKTIVAGVGLFLLGVGSTYWLMADNRDTTAPLKTNPTVQHQPAMQAALTQLGNTKSESDSDTTETTGLETQNVDAATDNTADTTTLTHERFLADAEARRNQQLADKAEADRLEKLRHIKADSVDCKFWRQQQQTSSTAAKIEEKIKTHCLLPSDVPASASSSSADAP